MTTIVIIKRNPKMKPIETMRYSSKLVPTVIENACEFTGFLSRKKTTYTSTWEIRNLKKL